MTESKDEIIDIDGRDRCTPELLESVALRVRKFMVRELVLASKMSHRKPQLSKRHDDGDTLHFRKCDKLLLEACERTNRELVRASAELLGWQVLDGYYDEPPMLMIKVMDKIRETALERIGVVK